MSAPILGALAGVTIVVPDLDVALAAYGDHLGYRGAQPVPVGVVQATAWGYPQAADAQMAMLWPESGERRFVRLIQGLAPGFRPMASYGWHAAEIVVQDLDALAAQLVDSPFEIIGPPAALDFDFTDKIRAMQVVGPGGEVLYLTEIQGEIPGFALPEAKSFVGQLFIIVLGCRDITAAAQPYANLGRPAGQEIQARIDILSKTHDLPVSTRHTLATIALDEESLIEVDAFPAGTVSRAASSIGLPAGLAMASFRLAPGSAVPPDANRVFLGASDELIELLG